jgi:hypothetical protein
MTMQNKVYDGFRKGLNAAAFSRQTQMIVSPSSDEIINTITNLIILLS